MLVLLATNCHKTNSSAPVARAVVGFWVGKYGNGNDTPVDGYAYLFRSNGTVRVYDDQDTASGSAGEGTYVLNDSTVTTTYSIDIQAYSSVGMINSASTEISGTWKSGAGLSGGGMFILNKIQ